LEPLISLDAPIKYFSLFICPDFNNCKGSKEF
jgi:hypothetical protein